MTLLFQILLAAIPVLLAITLHEAAHARAALWCGDSTAKALGRITLNPIKHIDPIDPIGSIAVPLGLLLLSSTTGGMTPIFGWAKPVPINMGQLRNPLRDQFWVAGAGPASNAVMLLGWWLIYLLADGLNIAVFSPLLGEMAVYGVFANLALMLLNLIPILPLDGGRILQSLLPRRMAYQYSQTERYGFMIILFLLMSNSLSLIFTPAFRFTSHLLF